MRQELLGKQEKTQKSIKRLVDFIKVMQLTTDNSQIAQSSVPKAVASVSCHPQPCSSQSPQIRSPSPHCHLTPSPPTSPTHPSASTLSPISIRASPTSNPTPQPNSPSSSTSSSRSCPIIHRSYQRIAPKVKISLNHHLCSTTSSPEAPRSPFPDSTPSPKSLNWSQRVKSPQAKPLESHNHVSVLIHKQSQQSQVIYTTQCSQAITSPISSPIVLISPGMYEDKTRSPKDSLEDSPRIVQPIGLDSPPPSSPNT